MISVNEIEELREYYTNKLYGRVRQEQRIDDEFYNDTFEVPQLEPEVPRSRTGGGAEIIDIPTEQISAAALYISRQPLKQTIQAQDAANRISSMMNRTWVDKIARMNLVKEFVKNQFLRGEAWIHPIHNERWVMPVTDSRGKTITDSKGMPLFDRRGLPVIFLIPDPMYVFASPNEDEDGIPENVIVFYERMPWVIKQKYPAWTNPMNAGETGNKGNVVWMEYWDKDVRYFSADGEPVLKGAIQENEYHFNPWVHKNAGFGKLISPEGKMEDVIVGHLRKYRDLLMRECAMTSDIDYVMHTYANRSFDVRSTDPQREVPEDFADNYKIGSGLIREIPSWVEVKRAEEALPETQAFQYLYSVREDLGRKTPLTMMGQPVGQSGRLQDMTYATAMRRFEGIVRNTETAFATAFGMALEMMERIPQLRPDELHEGDIGHVYQVTVELKAKDPVDEDRRKTMGSRLYQMGEIDLMTNLTEYQGYTQEEAREIMTNILVDQVTFKNPAIAELMGLIAADEMGMGEEYKFIKQMRQKMEGTAQEPAPSIQQRMAGETKTPLGNELMDVFMGGYGARRSPQNYTRGA